jgi:type IV secretory pathway protease TraF
MLLVQRQPAPGAFVWNFTASVPVGLYHIDAKTWMRGDRVAIQPTARLADILLRARVLEPGHLLLKRVAAARGDIVCRDGETVSVNGTVVARAKTIDSRGVRLPSWSGCERLGTHQVLLLGEMSESFDGRYFGSTGADDIVGKISAVILLPGNRVDASHR